MIIIIIQFEIFVSFEEAFLRDAFITFSGVRRIEFQLSVNWTISVLSRSFSGHEK